MLHASKLFRSTHALALAGMCATFALLLTAHASAQDPDPTEPHPQPVNADAESSPRAEQIAQLIEQLGSVNARARERAQARLARLGGEAIPALRRTLLHSDAEVRQRARMVLTEVGEDFIALCALLSERDARIRDYAAEALLARFLSTDGADREPEAYQPWYGRWNDPGQQGMVNLETLQLGSAEFNGTLLEFLQRIDELVPVVIEPRLFEMAALGKAITIPEGSMAAARPAIATAMQEADIQLVQIYLPQARCGALLAAPTDLIGAEATPEATIVIKLCKAALHDDQTCRRTSICTLGRLYGKRRSVAEMLLASFCRPGNPCFEPLVLAFAFSGRKLADALPSGDTRVRDAIVANVGRGTWATRRASALALASWPAETVLPVARDYLSNGDAAARYLAIWAVGLTGALEMADDADAGGLVAEPGSLTAALYDRLTDKQPDVARAAIEALTQLAVGYEDRATLGDRTPGIAAAVERALAADARDTLQQAVVEFLANVPAVPAAVVARGLEAYVNGEAPTRRFVVRGLAGRGITRAELVTWLVDEKDNTVALEILDVLGRDNLWVDASDEEAVLLAEVETILRDDDRDRRQLGADVLVRLSLERGLALVQRLLGEKPDLQLQVLAFRLGDEGQLQALLAALKGEDEAVAIEAAHGIASLGTGEALKTFEACKAEKAETTRLAALQGMDELARIAAQNGDVQLVGQIYQSLWQFNSDESQRVVMAQQQISNKFFQGEDGYHTLARRRASEIALGDASATFVYPSQPARPDLLPE